MVSSDIGFRGASNGTPTDNTSAIGGAKNTSNLDDTADNLLISNPPISLTDDKSYYNIAYFENLSTTEKLTDGRITNRNGAKLNSIAGTVQAVSNNPADTGVLKFVGKKSSAWIEATVTLQGTITVYGTDVIDAFTLYRWEYLLGGVPTLPKGNITAGVGGETLTVMYGGTSDRGTSLCSAEYTLAIANSKNTALNSSNRLTAPSGITAFSSATKWSGSDESFSVPTGQLVPADYIGLCLCLTIKAGIPKPTQGWESPFLGILGTPQNV